MYFVRIRPGFWTFDVWHGITPTHVWLYVLFIVAELDLRVSGKWHIGSVDLGWVWFVDLRVVHTWVSCFFPLLQRQISLAKHCVWFVQEIYWLSFLGADSWNETSLTSHVALSDKVLTVSNLFTVISLSKLSWYFQKLVLLCILS